MRDFAAQRGFPVLQALGGELLHVNSRFVSIKTMWHDSGDEARQGTSAVGVVCAFFDFAVRAHLRAGCPCQRTPCPRRRERRALLGAAAGAAGARPSGLPAGRGAEHGVAAGGPRPQARHSGFPASYRTPSISPPLPWPAASASPMPRLWKTGPTGGSSASIRAKDRTRARAPRSAPRAARWS